MRIASAVKATLHYKEIRRFYGNIPGIWLPVHLPLFSRESTCEAVLEMVMLTPENTFVGLKGYMTKNNICPLLMYCACFMKMFT